VNAGAGASHAVLTPSGKCGSLTLALKAGSATVATVAGTGTLTLDRALSAGSYTYAVTSGGRCNATLAVTAQAS
jgi:hypothetical protein